MNSEYEVRVLDIDVDSFIKQIEKLGAIYVNKYEQKRYIYDFNPKIDNKWIRLRTDGFKTTLAIKEYQSAEIGGTKEIEIEVSDIEKTDEILNQLGYFKRSIQENKRIRYILNDVEIDIDTWPYLNTYVEFEGKNKKSVQDLLKLLEIDENSITTMDAQDIYLANGFTLEDLNNLKF
mgnify:FL=1